MSSSLQYMKPKDIFDC